ncbi:GNAT family N-acetyltransferase [Paractinoplanes atraurantiacus]|uniref:Acetyltransferase (GNAT) domain-containing protein n=1 Tax=Paractinoplanes atraurantiacus TaxID=1036182 RepID=A0A285J884_9ACTN|nr:GNAT family N-acetyltransferase [Actinoplanes atraurantiacus]SNY56535.1 Acetyltransferase (GNAT) domain-containing protein [Actinoplanes atraurantiacus]
MTITAHAALLDPGAREWKEALQRTGHDIYHLPDYVSLDASLCGGRPAALWYEDAGRHALLPLIVRDIPGADRRDAMSPYGYPGLVGSAMPGDRPFWERACAAMVATMREAGLVSAFVRMHPLVPSPQLPVLAEFGTLVRHGETVSMDLTVSVEEMWRQTRADHRNHINRARRAGTRVVFDDWERLAEWVAVYHDNMRRVGAQPYYFFTYEHLAALHDAIGDRMHLAVALEGDEVVGGNTFFEYDGIATGYVSSTRRAKHRYADELLYDEVRRWCRERGDTAFHLGGGRGGRSDSLFSYKAGFSPRRHAFHTWRVIADPQAYLQLVRDLKPGADPADVAGTFPPYR